MTTPKETRQKAIEILTLAKLVELEAAGFVVVDRAALASIVATIDDMTQCERPNEFMNSFESLIDALCGTQEATQAGVVQVLKRSCAVVRSPDSGMRVFMVDFDEAVAIPRCAVRVFTMQPTEVNVVEAWVYTAARSGDIEGVIVVALAATMQDAKALNGWLPDEIAGKPVRLVILAP
jgi:hypothetical protein